jgi:Ran GTPase-activating protein (RanGAP) involved in mRNA processing and transport
MDIKSSPEKTREFIRNSRKRLRESGKSFGSSFENDPPVDIYVSPKKSFMASPASEGMLRLRESEEYLTIASADGSEFVVPLEITFQSGLIQRLFESEGNYKERVEKKINIPAYSHEILEKVFQFCFEDYLLNSHSLRSSSAVRRNLFGSPQKENLIVVEPVRFPSPDQDNSFLMDDDLPLISPPYNSPSLSSSRTLTRSAVVQRARVAFCVEISPQFAMELLMAAHYLEIPDLLETVCRMVADNIDGVEDLSGVPSDVVLQIYRYLDHDQLLKIENSPMHPVGLDTSPLWQRHYERRGWDLHYSPFVESWTAELNEINEYIEVEDRSDPTHVLSDNWKALYLRREFMHRTVCMTSQEQLDSLFQFFELCKDYLEELSIRPQFVQISGLHMLYFAERLPNLTALDLSDNIMTEDLVQALVDLLAKNPRLTRVKMSRCCLKDTSIGPLFTQFDKTQNLVSLDLCDNQLTTRSLSSVAEWLAHPSCSLVRLSLRDNSIKSKRIGLHDTHEDYLEKLFRALCTNNRLELLDLGINDLILSGVSDEIWLDLPRNTSLKYLLLKDNTLIQDDHSSLQFHQLITSLPRNLLALSLSQTQVSTSQLVALTQVLSKPNASLRHLDISENLLGVHSSDQVADLIRFAKNLYSLNLRNNGLRDSGGNKVAAALHSAPQLRYLDLEKNILRTSTRAIVAAIHNDSKLRVLNMNGNPLDGNCFNEIQEQFRSKATKILMSSL